MGEAFGSSTGTTTPWYGNQRMVVYDSDSTTKILIVDDPLFDKFFVGVCV